MGTEVCLIRRAGVRHRSGVRAVTAKAEVTIKLPGLDGIMVRLRQ